MCQGNLHNTVAHECICRLCSSDWRLEAGIGVQREHTVVFIPACDHGSVSVCGRISKVAKVCVSRDTVLNVMHVSASNVCNGMV